MWLLILALIILVIIFAIIGMYNNLVSLKMRVKNAWAQIDTQLKRRFDLIPNLVETVKGYTAHEQETLEKVKELKKYINENNIDIDIEVDGGINDKTAFDAVNSGANILVAGNYLTSAENINEAVQKLKI